MTTELELFLKDHIDLIRKEEFNTLVHQVAGETKQELCALLCEIGWFDTSEKWINADITLGKYCPEHVDVPEGVTYISNDIFSGSFNLKSVKLPQTLERIKYSCFYNSGITSIRVPDSVRFIEAEAFEACYNLEYATLPATLQEIGWGIFNDCVRLKSITIPRSVRFIGDEAFCNCKSLKRINYQGTVEDWDNIQIDNTSFIDVPDKTVHCIDGYAKADII